MLIDIINFVYQNVLKNYIRIYDNQIFGKLQYLFSLNLKQTLFQDDAISVIKFSLLDISLKSGLLKIYTDVYINIRNLKLVTGSGGKDFLNHYYDK